MSLALNAIDPPIRFLPESPMSNADFMRFCAANEPMRFERKANGEIIVMSPTGTDGGGMELDVAAELRYWARQDGRGRAFGPNSGVQLPDGSVRAADAAWVSWQRWNSLSSEDREGFAPICPEFVIEVRSRTDRLPPLQEKMEQWISNGAEVAWLIDPIEKVVTVYRPGAEPEHHANPSSVQGMGPVAGFELVLARVWGSDFSVHGSKLSL